mgnify:CR=1 FL=1
MYHKEYIPVYKAWTQLFTENIEAKLADFLSFRAKKDSLTMLSHRIIALSLDVLQKYVSSYIEQFNPFFIVSSEILPKEDLEKYITDAAKELSKKGMDAFNEEFPLLKEKIIKRCELFISFINEMTQRIIDNKKEISDSLLNGKSFSSITGLSANGADVHNNGQTSVVVHTDAGAFVYKPHDCSSDIIFTKIQNLFFQDIFKTPEVLFVSDKYSFCEFITNKPAATEKNASRYYFNLGGMCAVMTFLGSTDFHEENILANEIYPVPIDLETVFMSRKANRYQSTPEEDFNYSSFKTTMFSVRCIEPEFRESSPLFDISDANVSAPVINGQRQSVFQYQEHFKKGFSEVYTRCLGLKKDLLNIINEKPDMKIRIILKNTNYYSLMSDRLNSYFNMKDNSLHDKCLSELMTYDSEDISKKELSSMENGDIPYFYLALNSRNLYSHNGFCHENFLEISPEEALKTSFDLRNREELEFELTLIDKLIANAINIQNDPEPVVFNSDDPLERAAAIFSTIEKQILLSPSKKTYFIELRDNAYPSMTGFDLKHGKTGIALFFAALSFITPDSELKERSKKLCERFVHEIKYSCDIHKPSNDLPLIHKGLILISAYLGVKPDLPEPDCRMENKMSFDSNAVFRDSLVGGNAGIADALIEKHLETKDKSFLKQAESLLLEKSSYHYASENVPELFVSGLFYGASGIGYELLRLAQPEKIRTVF